MPKNKKASLARAIILCALIFFETSAAPAQSMRRSLTSPRLVSPNSDAPSVEAYKESLPEKDVDLFVGKIIRKDADKVIVYVMSTPARIPDRTPLYYACDAKMRPTAVLENLNIIHKACAAFQVSQGSVMLGDVVMVKYIAPKKTENSEGEKIDKTTQEE